MRWELARINSEPPPIKPSSTDLFPYDTAQTEGYPTDPGNYEVAFELQARGDEGAEPQPVLSVVIEHDSVPQKSEIENEAASSPGERE